MKNDNEKNKNRQHYHYIKKKRKEKMGYENLFEKMPRYISFKDIKPLKKLYDALSGDESVAKMIAVNDIARRPAICGMIEYIVKFCNRHKEEGLDLSGKDGHFLRRFIGAMINDILTARGYRRGKNQKIIGGDYSEYSQYFSSGACYEKSSAGKANRKKTAGSSLGRKNFRQDKKHERNDIKNEKHDGIRKTDHIPVISRAIEIDDPKIKISDILRSIDLNLYIREAFQTAAAAAFKIQSNGEFRGDKFAFRSMEGVRYPFSDIILEHAFGHYMSAFQIAAEIELNHPGIVELAGTFFSDEYEEFTGRDDEETQAHLKKSSLQNDDQYLEPSFVDIIERHLIRECLKNNEFAGQYYEPEGFEIAAISDFCSPRYSIYRNAEFVAGPANGPIPVFRPRVSRKHDILIAEKISGRAAGIDSTYSSQFFDKFNLAATIPQTLSAPSQINYFDAYGDRFKQSRIFLTLNQLKKKLFDDFLRLIEENEKMPDHLKHPEIKADSKFLYNLDNYPGYAIYLELARRRLPQIFLGFLSSRHLTDFSLSRYYEIEAGNNEKLPAEEYDEASGLSEFGSYIPLFAYNG